MNHFASPSFWSAYRALPDEVRSVADKNFALLKDNPRHPSLRLKKVGRSGQLALVAGIVPSPATAPKGSFGSGSVRMISTTA